MPSLKVHLRQILSVTAVTAQMLLHVGSTLKLSVQIKPPTGLDWAKHITKEWPMPQNVSCISHHSTVPNFQRCIFRL